VEEVDVDKRKAMHEERCEDEFNDEGTVPEEVIAVDATDDEVYVRPSSKVMKQLF